MNEHHWSEFANCATTDPEIFFPEGHNSRMAKKVCDMCSVKDNCLAEQLTIPIDEQFGVAGGMNAKARKAILKGLVTV